MADIGIEVVTNIEGLDELDAKIGESIPCLV